MYFYLKYSIILTSRRFLPIIKQYLKPNTTLFINNVVDYGIPDYFHLERPKSIEHTKSAITHLGFNIVKEGLKLPSRESDSHRLMLCVEYMAFDMNEDTKNNKIPHKNSRYSETTFTT